MTQLPGNIDKWQIREPVSNKVGGKTAAILDENGGPIVFITCGRSPFDASGYSDPEASRVGLCLEADSSLVSWCSGLDEQILKLCCRQSKLLFGKDVVIVSDLRPLYYSAIKPNEKYGTHLFKMKMNKVGKGAL